MDGRQTACRRQTAWSNFRRLEFQTARCIADKANDVDLALCATDWNLTDHKTKVRPVQFDSAQQPDGTAVAYTGFHLGNLTPMTARGYISMYTHADGLVVDQGTWLGASGSPVYLSDGSSTQA